MSDDAEFMSVTSVSLGRHSRLTDDSDCRHAVKKEIMVDTTDDVGLYVRVECDDCGVVNMGSADVRTVDE